MRSQKLLKVFAACMAFLVVVTACSLGGAGKEAQEAQVEKPPVAEEAQPPQPPTMEPTAEPTSVPTVEITHVDVPAAASGKESTIHDHLSSDSARNKEAYAGDDYFNDRFERPFSREMDYLPWLDIVDAKLLRQEPFFYFSLVLQQRDFPGDGETPVYGFEIDTDIDGRGDVLVQTLLPPDDSWGQAGVTVWEDANKDVGGETPIFSDKAFGGGDGYERLLFEEGVGDDPDLAWSRLNPDDPKRVDIALHSTHFPPNVIFLWGGFADGFAGGPESFDLNDRFSPEEAGSAMKSSEFYPLKNFFAFDNTCRTASGFDPGGGEPGLCPNIVPQAPGRVKQCTEVCNPRTQRCTTVCE